MNTVEKIACLNIALAALVIFSFWIIASHFFRKVEAWLIKIHTEGGLVSYSISEKAKTEAAISAIAATKGKIK